MYLTNFSASLTTNQGTTVTFQIEGGQSNVIYDILVATNLVGANTTNFQWTWLGQGYTCCSYTFLNQPGTKAFYALGRPSLSMVLAWGGNSSNQCNVPSNLSNVVQVVGGFAYSLALKSDGTLAAWGGLTNVPNGLTNVAAIAGGAFHSLALKADGTVTNWGLWDYDNIFATATVTTNLTNVVGISAGLDHDLALKADGSVIFFGYTNDPVEAVPSDLSGVTAIASGWTHDLALLTNGTVRAWGLNWGIYNWNLTNVPSGLSNVVAIAAGAYHSLALKSDGTVVAWGAGSLVDTNSFEHYGQSLVPTNLSGVVAIAAGGDQSMALKSDGTLVTWGITPSPDYSAGFQSNVFAVGAGVSHSLALCSGLLPPAIVSQPANVVQAAGGSATFSVTGVGPTTLTYQWQFNGTNISGATNSSLTLTNVQLAQNGNYRVIVTDASGSSTSSNANFTLLGAPQLLSITPATPFDTLLVTNIVLSAAATDADTGTFPLYYQWQVNGTNITGATNTNYFLLTSVSPPSALEGDYSLVISNAVGITNAGLWRIRYLFPGMVTAWGADNYNQLERPTTLTNVIGIAAGEFHSVGVREDGIVLQWGATPAAVPSDLTNAVAVAAGYEHSIALRQDGTVTTWGASNAAANFVPTDLTGGVSAIAAGWNHNVALLTNGTVRAWGENVSLFGWTPTNVPPDLTNAIAIGTGALHGLAVRSNGTVVAWGYNGNGQTNVPSGLSNVVAVAGGTAHSLALTSDGKVTAWGDNSFGQCSVPPGLSNVMAISAGASHSVALKNDGTVVAWGDNSHGETNVPPFPSTIKLIAAGANFTLAGAFSSLTQYYPIDVSKDLLLIYNTNSVNSSNVMAYYLANRPGVSNANVLRIGYTNNVIVSNASPYCNITNAYYTNNYETITLSDLTNQILSPLRSWLGSNPTKRPAYVVLFLDVPSRVVDPEWNTFPACGSYPQGPTVPTYASVQCQINSNCAAGWAPFVTSINMNGTNDCIGYVDKLKTFATNGGLIISASANGYGNANYCMDDTRTLIDPPQGLQAEVGLLAASVSSSNIFYLDGIGFTNRSQQLLSGTNVAGYFSWGAHSFIDNNYATAGTVSFHGNSSWYLIRTVESFNGRRYETDQETFLGWFSSNAFGGTNYSNTPVGAASYVDEPGPAGTVDYTYFPFWATGKNFSICAWNSRGTQYFQAVGDPFVRR